MMKSDDFTTTRLIMDGARSLRTAEESHAILREAVRDYSHVEIDLSGVEEADLSFIQLILSARATALRENRTLKLAYPVTSGLRDLLERVGFLSGMTEASLADREFWLKGGDA